MFHLPSYLARVFLAVFALAVLAITPCSAQRTITLDENFDAQPLHWTLAEEYHDQNVDRWYEGGALKLKRRNALGGWIYRSAAIDPHGNWQVRLQFQITKATGAAGVGIHVQSGSAHYVFQVAPAIGAYWAGSYDEATRKFTSYSPKAPDGSKHLPSALVKPVGQATMLTLQRTGDTLEFMIDDASVQRFGVAATYPGLDHELNNFGIYNTGQFEADIQSFTATYVEENIAYDAGAFVEARKTYVQELNGGKSDRYAVIAPNGASVYWIRKDSATGDDIMTADRATDSTWANIRPIGHPLNNKAPNNVVSASQDNNELFLWTRYNADGSPAGSGFSRTRRTGTGWEVPRSLTIVNYRNKARSREECVSADRSVAILAIQTGVTSGDKDLYVSFRLDDTSYAEPRNLGSVVNSEYTESMPYLASDNHTLYFASRRPGFGDADIWVTKRLDDTWMLWSAPVNMGPTINSNGWDGYFSMHPSGRYAYMNSSDGLRSGLVRVSLPQDEASRRLLPSATSLVFGRVLNAKTGRPIATTIAIADMGADGTTASAISEPAEGRFSIVLQAGHSYGFHAAADGYFPVSDNLDLSDLKEYREVQRDLLLWPLEVGAVIRLNNIFFDTDKADLGVASHEELKRLVQLLEEKPTMSIEIGGHTDDRASDEHNMKLSAARAESVRAFLLAHGVRADRMEGKGYGESRPLVQGATDEARQQNRRVEFTITAM